VPDFFSSTGEPTGALYGLISTILRIVADLKPDYLIATRDLPGGTFRDKILESYKGTRRELDDTLRVQLEKAPQVFEAFGIPVYSAPGYEADDCLGTIVEQLKHRDDVEVIIASGDMDTLQLVSDKVKVYTMRKGLTDTVMYDSDRVHERYGFGPEHVVDYKALRGDPSDNIPGVKGIGEKTATELIENFGSVEDLYRALDAEPDSLVEAGVKPRIIELLKMHKADAFMSKELATIHPNVPIDFSLPEIQWSFAQHISTIEALCEELEFKSLKERVHAAIKKNGNSSAPISSTTEEISTPDEAIDLHELQETSMAQWLLNSDVSNPSLGDVLEAQHTQSFAEAREKICASLKSTGRLQEVFDTIEKPLIPIVNQMNANGVHLDVVYLKKLAHEYRTELERIEKQIHLHAGHEFNINSPKQLAVVLYDELKIIPEKQKKTAGGARTTREDELIKLSAIHPIIEEILSYRELQKLLSTYIDKLPDMVAPDGRLHTTFVQAGTTTGRIASDSPNVQNIPIKTDYGRRIRNAFVADEGNVLVAVDYSQIELRIAAGLSGDEKLATVFREGGDVHTAVASEVFGVPAEKVDKEMRRKAKVINFGILYGMGVNALRANLGVDTPREDAAEFLRQYFRNFSGLAHWIEDTKAFARTHGYTETLFGRRRYFREFKSSLPGIVASAERMAVNAPIQGTQADIIKRAMVDVDQLIEKKKWRDSVRLVLQVHDELVYEIARDGAEDIAREIRSVMENAVPVEKLSSVPIIAEASIGGNWGEMRRLTR
jgi:DNA polymerase-1